MGAGVTALSPRAAVAVDTRCRRVPPPKARLAQSGACAPPPRHHEHTTRSWLPMSPRWFCSSIAHRCLVRPASSPVWQLDGRPRHPAGRDRWPVASLAGQHSTRSAGDRCGALVGAGRMMSIALPLSSKRFWPLRLRQNRWPFGVTNGNASGEAVGGTRSWPEPRYHWRGSGPAGYSSSTGKEETSRWAWTSLVAKP